MSEANNSKSGYIDILIQQLFGSSFERTYLRNARVRDDFDVTFDPQCGFLNGVKLDFKFSVPSPPADILVMRLGQAPVETPPDTPVLALVVATVLALSMKMFRSKLLSSQLQRNWHHPQSF
jgi:hypothetical protein